jgi:polygalacturonase
MNNAPVQLMHAPMARRSFLKQSAMVAIPLAIGGFSLPALAAYVPPTRTRGSTVLNVKNYGALGNGIHDDTAAIQAAINALPSTGGTVFVPAGTYMIDTVKKIQLRSYMLLQLDPAAILKAKTSSVGKASVVYIYGKTHVEVAGGRIIGERDTHKYMTTSTDEWNMGVQIKGGTHVTVRDLHVSKCTGDGVCVGGGSSDVVIANIISTGNRRQGLSITNCNTIKVYDSEFSYTSGTAPECGIDIEPDPGYTCSNIWIENCRVNNNRKYGINIWKNASNITLTRNTLEYNTSLGMGTVGCSGLTVTNNVIRYNGTTGVVYNDGTKNVNHSGNLSYGNYSKLSIRVRTPFTLTGWASKIERDILLRGTLTAVTIGTNNYQ